MRRSAFASVAVILIYWPGILGLPAAELVGQERSLSARLISPNGLARDAEGALYISDIGSHQVLKLARAGGLTVVAGTGTGGFGGDGGPAIRAQLFAPHGLAFDAQGRLLIADTFNHRIRRLGRDGTITTIAGTGVSGYAGDNGPAIAAALNGPQDVAVDGEGRILIADSYNAVVRRIDAAGVIATFAGSEPGLGGDGGPAAKALINLPTAVCVAADGSVYLSDAANSRIRRVAADGTIETVIGSGGGSGLGGAGFGGDGGPANKGKAFSAMGLHCGAPASLYVSDSGNNRIRVVRNGVIETVAGTGSSGFGGDGGRAFAAALNTPQKIVVGPDGTVYIADRGNSRIRMIDPAGMISTIAGDGGTH